MISFFRRLKKEEATIAAMPHYLKEIIAYIGLPFNLGLQIYETLLISL